MNLVIKLWSVKSPYPQTAGRENTISLETERKVTVMTREQQMYFDQCMDFLARMIEKYGDQIKFPDTFPDDCQEDQDRSIQACEEL